MTADSGSERVVGAVLWPCDDYQPPLTCWTVPSGRKTLVCEGCRSAFPNGPEVQALYDSHRDLVSRLGFGNNITEPMADNDTIVAWFEEQGRDAAEWREHERFRDDCYAAGHPDDEDCAEHGPTCCDRPHPLADQAQTDEAGLRAGRLVTAGLVTTCREEGEVDRCDLPAEFILWGKLFPPEALGPRCYGHAVDHTSHAMPSRSDQWAVADLRPLRALTAADQPDAGEVR